jgi:hypothetical protein
MEAADYRPLQPRERELLIWLLEHGPVGAKNFLPQLEVIEARSSCSCPSIEFRVPLASPFINSPQGMKMHALGQSKV